VEEVRIPDKVSTWDRAFRNGFIQFISWVNTEYEGSWGGSHSPSEGSITMSRILSLFDKAWPKLLELARCKQMIGRVRCLKYDDEYSEWLIGTV
jgi:hypothetical protein